MICRLMGISDKLQQRRRSISNVSAAISRPKAEMELYHGRSLPFG